MNPFSLTPLILVVAADYGTGLILTKRLESFGFNVEIAGTNTGVVEYLKITSRIPDLILVNFVREDQALLSLPEKLKESTKWGHHVPCAAYSAIHDRQFILKVLKSGFADYILRPIEHELFRNRVETLTKKTVNLSGETYRRPMSETASLQLDVQLDQVNEFGLVASSGFYLPANLVFTIHSQSLTKTVGRDLQIRVVGTREISAGRFEHIMTFVALEAGQVRQLRQFALLAQTVP